MKTAGSVKVVHDRGGAPWLIVGTDDGYEAQRLLVVERRRFRRSWQAIAHVVEPSATDREVEAVHMQAALAMARAELANCASDVGFERHSAGWWVGHLESVLRVVLEQIDEHTPSGPHVNEVARP